MGHYQRLGVVALDQVLPAVRARLINPEAPKFIEILGAIVKVSGLRLRTFAERPLCCSNPECNSQATHFALERNIGDPQDSPKIRPYHLNLYGTNSNGDEVLFTHDHTLARGLGGDDTIENTTTMCLPCNQKKSRLEGAIANYRRRQAEILEGVQPLRAGPSDRKMQRQNIMFQTEREQTGLSAELFRTYCHEQGMVWRKGEPLDNRGSKDPRRRIAGELGMSLEGYLFMRHLHNERMRRLLAAPIQQIPSHRPQMR